MTRFVLLILAAASTGIIAAIVGDVAGFDPSWSLGFLVGLVYEWSKHRGDKAEIAKLQADLLAERLRYQRLVEAFHADLTGAWEEAYVIVREAYEQGVRDGAGGADRAAGR